MFTIPTDKLYKFLATISLIVFIVFLLFPQIANLYFSSLLAQVQMNSMQKDIIEENSLKILNEIRSANISTDSVLQSLKPIEENSRTIDSLISESKKIAVESAIYRQELNKVFGVRRWVLVISFLVFLISVFWWLYEDLSENIKARITLKSKNKKEEV